MSEKRHFNETFIVKDPCIEINNLLKFG